MCVCVLEFKTFLESKKKVTYAAKINYPLNMTPAHIQVDSVLCIAKLKWEADVLRLGVLVTQTCIMAQRSKFNKY